MAFFPIEDMINMQNNYDCRTELEYHIDHMKNMLLHAIHKETYDIKKLKDKICVMVELIPENGPDIEFREYIEKTLSDNLRNMEVMIRTKNGLEKVNFR